VNHAINQEDRAFSACTVSQAELACRDVLMLG
jgi:hypothetical protein